MINSHIAMRLPYSKSMTLKQLKFLREVARQSLNISNAAIALHTSQPGVSRQVQELEAELGVELLVRRKNRVLALTEAGEGVVLGGPSMVEKKGKNPPFWGGIGQKGGGP